MYPSPFRDDGYDIADYYNIHPSYGTLRGLQRASSKRRTRAGLRVIIELVINHTSDQHPWFQQARSSRDNPRRDWYVWSDTDDRYRGVRIIFIDTERSNWAWDPVSKAYYWHRFFSHQPDLNYDNPAVREEIWKVMKFWLDLGVDGFRVDAVPYLVEREGTSCENLPETHDVLKELRAASTRTRRARCCSPRPTCGPRTSARTSATATSSTCRSTSRIMPRMFMALRLEDRKPLIDIIERTPEHPRLVPVGHLPAQPRRADARDGDRDRARLHVSRVRAGPAGAHQPRHPPTARAAAGGRSAPHRADDRPADVAARQPVRLLRRRDRHGRQHLPRRSQQRAHADAVERRLQRRLLHRRPRAAVAAAHLESRLRLSGRQRRVAAPQRHLAAQLDAAAHPDAEDVDACSAAATIDFLDAANHRVLAFTRALGRRTSSWSCTTWRARRRSSSSTWPSTTGAIPIEMFGGSIFPRVGTRALRP